MRAIKPALFLCLAGMTVACYIFGLTGPFTIDDGINIRLNPYLRIDSLNFFNVWHASSSGGTRPLARPISMASFAVNYYFFGMNPYFFKATNLAIHLINGLLVFVLVKLLLGLHLRIRGAANDSTASWMGIAVAAIWLLHPFNLTGVLYVVQRMTSLAALFSLAGLTLYIYGRKRLLDGNRSGFFVIGAALFVFTPLAAMCKESGVLLPLLILVCEATMLRWSVPDRGSRRILTAVVGLSVAVPLLLCLIYVSINPDLILGGYVWRDFSLTERLLTEARALWFYLQMIVLPNLGSMGLHHDDFTISRSLFSPWTTLPAVTGIVLLAAIAFAVRKKHPLITFGIAFFFTGHAMESTIIPLEPVFEHRNYLPMLGILLPLAYYSLNAQLHLPSARARQVAFVSLLILFAGLTAARAQQWGNTLMMRTLEVDRHPGSVRAHMDLAILYDYLPANSQEDAINLYQKARFHYQQAADIDLSSISGLFGILAMNAHRGIPIEAPLLTALEQRLAFIPFGPPNMNTLIGATKDIASGHIVIDSNSVDRIFRAAISNPRLNAAERNHIVIEFGKIPQALHPQMDSLQ